MSQLVHTETQGRLGLIAMDDGKANALSHAMLDALDAVLDEFERRDDIGALVLTGREGRFCAGFDLGEMRKGGDAQRALLEKGARLAFRLYEYPRPVVMACSGHALAMGAILLFTADWRTGAEGAFRIGMNETAIGMTMPAFGAGLAQDRLTPRHFSRAVLGAEIYAPSLAVEAGFLDEVVDPLSVVDFAAVAAERLAALDPRAYAATKRRTRAATLAALRSGLAADLAGLRGE